MRVPTYKTQNTLTTKTGSNQLSVKANPGQFAQTGQAVAQLGQVAQRASLNALGAAQKAKLEFQEMELKNTFEVEKEIAILSYNKGLVDFQIEAKTQDPYKADQFFSDKAKGLKDKLLKNFTSEAAKKDFMAKSEFDFLNKSVSVRTSSATRRIDDQASVYVARVEQLESMAVFGNLVEKTSALSLLHGKNGIFDKLVGLGYWTKTNGEIKKAASKENILKGTIVNNFQKLPTIEEKKSYLETLEKSPPPALGVIGTRTIISNLRSDITRAESIIKKEATVLKSDIKELRQKITLGVPIDNDTFESFEAKAIKQGFYGAENRQLLSEVKIGYSVMTELKKTNPFTLNNLIKEFEDKGIGGIGGSGKDTLLEGEIVKDAKDLLANMTKELKSDPLKYADKVGIVDIKNINFTSRDSKEAIAKRIAKAQTVSGNYGSELKLLTATETDLLKNLYSNPATSKDEKLSVLSNLVNGFGSKYAQNVLQELSMKGANDLAHVGGLMVQGNISAATLALDGIEKINAGVKPVEYTPSTTASYFTEIGAALSELDPSVQSSGVNVVKQIYTSLASNQGVNTFNDELFAKAIQLTFGGTDSGTGGIDKVNNEQTLIPPQLNADILENMLENIDAGQISDLNGMIVDQSLIKSINRNQYNLYAVGEGVYKLGRGRKTSGTFAYATTPDGIEIEIDAVKYFEKYGMQE